MKQSIGEFLAALRRAHGYTQQEVADRLSVSNRTVSAWERGAALPDILLLPALAELYGVTTDELLAGERRAETVRPALSEKSENKLLKNKMNAFFMQAFILFGIFATGYLLFFIGWLTDAKTVVWSGWQWWLVLLFLGLAAAVICAVCILALWRSATLPTATLRDIPHFVCSCAGGWRSFRTSPRECRPSLRLWDGS